MTRQQIAINGMSCNHCVMAVKKELQKLEGVRIHDVQVGRADVEYDETKTNRTAINDAIRTAGYQPV